MEKIKYEQFVLLTFRPAKSTPNMLLIPPWPAGTEMRHSEIMRNSMCHYAIIIIPTGSEQQLQKYVFQILFGANEIHSAVGKIRLLHTELTAISPQLASNFQRPNVTVLPLR